MLTNKELQNFHSLISNTEIANIEIALEIAKTYNIPINTTEVNEIYQFLFGVKDDLINRSSLSKKLRALNLYPKLILDIKQGTINPKSFLHLRNLKEVIIKTKISSPQFIITYIKEIFNIKSIDKLSLVNYQFSYLPISIENLKNLEVLSLKGAKLKELPVSIGKLKNLKIIDLTNSSLKILPKSIQSLQKLKELNIEGTAIRIENGFPIKMFETKRSKKELVN